MAYEKLDLLKWAEQRPGTKYDPLGRHVGPASRLLADHRAQVAGDDPSLYLPHLYKRMIDPRTLRHALELLCANGDTSPGYSDVRLVELTRGEKWELVRVLSKSLKKETYRPGQVMIVQVPKVGRPGQFRTIAVQTPEDRIVAKAAALVLESIVEKAFSPHSFGFRPGRGTMTALVAARTMVETQGRTVWVSVDVADAFDSVQLNEVLTALQRLVPDEAVLNHIELLSRAGRRGLRQGSPLSPLLWNVFADHFIDRPWARDFPDLPLLRYADDIAVACRLVDEAEAAHGFLAKLAREAGTPLKEAAKSVFDLGGEPMPWLGYELRCDGGMLRINIADKAWDRLDDALESAHERAAAPLRAADIVQGWLNHVAPCLEFEDAPAVVERVIAAAAAQAFDEVPGRAELLDHWGRAAQAWQARGPAREKVDVDWSEIGFGK